MNNDDGTSFPTPRTSDGGCFSHDMSMLIAARAGLTGVRATRAPEMAHVLARRRLADRTGVMAEVMKAMVLRELAVLGWEWTNVQGSAMSIEAYLHCAIREMCGCAPHTVSR